MFLLLTAIAWLLVRPLSPRKAKQFAQSLVKEPVKAASQGDGRILLAAAQVELRPYLGLKEYVADMHRYVAEAAQQGARLIAFPELCGMLGLCALPWVRRLLKPGQEGDAAGQAQGKGNGNAPAGLARMFTALLKGISARLGAVHLGIFSVFAKAYGIVIMTGSAYVYEDGRTYNRAHLIDENGQVLGAQDKAHPVVLEQQLGISLAERIHLFDTGFIKLCMPVCMDATYYETFKICRNLEAQLVIIPIANQEPYNEHLALRGIEPRVQESGVYGLKSALVGDIAGVEFTGRSGIYAPIEFGLSDTGILNQAQSTKRREVVVAAIDPSLPGRRRDPYLLDTNPDFYRWARMQEKKKMGGPT